MLTAEQQETILELKPVAYALAKKRRNPWVELADLVGTAYLALVEAVADYPASDACKRGVPLKAYAVVNIKSQLSEMIRKQFPIKISKNTFRNMWAVQDYKDTEAAAKELGLTVSQIISLRRLANGLKQTLSLDAPIKDTEGMIPFGESLPGSQDVEAEVLDRLEREQTTKTISEAIMKLGRGKRNCLSLRLGVFCEDDFRLEEVFDVGGYRLGVSKALKKVRAYAGMDDKGGNFDYSRRGDGKGFAQQERKQRAADFWDRLEAGEEVIP
ncbi:MAG TPA: hypothetical protein DD719_06895 [Desulfotomaculum sp.]|nr:hypothetical protein [Desulfotomaculum sp.]